MVKHENGPASDHLESKPSERDERASLALRLDAQLEAIAAILDRIEALEEKVNKRE